MVGFPTSGWVSNQWVEIHPWWVNFQPFTLVGLGAVVVDEAERFTFREQKIEHTVSEKI